MTINVDYATSYFKYATPTHVHGKPTNKALKRLKNELRAKASSVESDLGGGDHGYLGIVLTDAKYTRVSTISFVASNFPPVLIVPSTSTAVEVVHLRNQCVDSIQLYCECKIVGKALLCHVQSAIY